jgi:hypothetical protein
MEHADASCVRGIIYKHTLAKTTGPADEIKVRREVGDAFNSVSKSAGRGGRSTNQSLTRSARTRSVRLAEGCKAGILRIEDAEFLPDCRTSALKGPPGLGLIRPTRKGLDFVVKTKI